MISISEYFIPCTKIGINLKIKYYYDLINPKLENYYDLRSEEITIRIYSINLIWERI